MLEEAGQTDDPTSCRAKTFAEWKERIAKSHQEAGYEPPPRGHLLEFLSNCE